MPTEEEIAAAEEARLADLTDEEREAEAAEKEEARLAALSDEEREAEEKAAADKEAADAEAARVAAEAEEDRKFKERAEKLGYKPPEAKAEVVDDTKPPEVPNFRQQAFAEAAKYPQFVDAEGKLTDEGYNWAEERAGALHAEAALAKDREERLIAEIAAGKPQLAEKVAAVYKEAGVPEDIAPAVGARYADIMQQMGPIAFEPDPTPTDPPAVKAKRELAQALRTDAYYRALGVQYAELLKAGKASAGEDDVKDAGKKNVPPITGGGAATNGNVYNRAMNSKDAGTKTFLSDFEKDRGRKPSATEMAQFVKEGVVVLS